MKRPVRSIRSGGHVETSRPGSLETGYGPVSNRSGGILRLDNRGTLPGPVCLSDVSPEIEFFTTEVRSEPVPTSEGGRGDLPVFDLVW